MSISNLYGVGAAPSQYQPVQQKRAAQNSTPTPKQDTFIRGTPAETTEEVTYQRPTKLTAEQVDTLKQQVQESMLALVEDMLGTQAQIAKLPDGSVDFDALAQQLGIGTTPETAAEAIGENGMWGVDAVSTRLIDMAMSLTNGDPEMVGEMREAIRKGFEAVGDLESLPQVCQDTYHETMKRLDYWETNGSMEGYGEAEEPAE